jgi:four helix bundle protein
MVIGVLPVTLSGMPPSGALRVIDAAEDFVVEVNRCFGRSARGRTYADQVRRSAGAVSGGLIEGYSRGPGADRQYRYLVASSECEESLGWIRKSYRLGELAYKDFRRLSNRGITIVRMIKRLKY